MSIQHTLFYDEWATVQKFFAPPSPQEHRSSSLEITESSFSQRPVREHRITKIVLIILPALALFTFVMGSVGLWHAAEGNDLLYEKAPIFFVTANVFLVLESVFTCLFSLYIWRRLPASGAGNIEERTPLLSPLSFEAPLERMIQDLARKILKEAEYYLAIKEGPHPLLIVKKGLTPDDFEAVAISRDRKTPPLEKVQTIFEERRFTGFTFISLKEMQERLSHKY